MSVKFRADRDTLARDPRDGLAGDERSSGPSLVSSACSSLLRGNRLEVCGSDPDLVIEASATCPGTPTGRCLVPVARLVVDIVRSFEPGAVTVTAGDEEVRFSSGRAEFVVRVADRRRDHAARRPRAGGDRHSRGAVC